IRHLQAGDRGRMAARAAGQLAEAARSMGGPRPEEQVEVTLGCSFQVRGGTLGVIADRPSRLIGLPFDRPVVGYGGKTINTLRLWAAAAPAAFDFHAFSAGEFVSALAERLGAESLTRVLYPDDSTSLGQAL